MPLHLTLPIVLRAAGPLLLLLLGLAMIALARGRREPILVGALLATIGGIVVSTNLVIAGAGEAGLVAGLALEALDTIAAGALIIHLLATTDRARRAWSMLVALVAVALGALATWDYLQAPKIGALTLVPPELAPGFQRYFAAAQMTGAFEAALPALWAIRAFSASSGDLRRDAGLAAGIGVFWGFAIGGDALSGPFGATVFVANALPLLVFLVGGALLWALVMARRESTAARGVALSILVAALAGALRVAATGQGLVFDPYAPQGLARLVGWTILALTVAHAGWLDIGFLSRHRTATAAAALALLFIVAQIAQNFFSAEFGLLTGGVVAGAFLFMASPLQRAVESLREREPRMMSRATAARAADDRAEALYCENLRIVLKDQRVTAEEEQHLAELGERLGISARRAVELRHDIEREKGAR